MTRRIIIAAMTLAAAFAAPAPMAGADDQRGADEIRSALERWRDDFNAGRIDAACALFSADLVATIRTLGDRGKDAMCAGLREAVARPGSQLTYALEIHDISVSGDLAVVRLDWTLAVRVGERTSMNLEKGMDVFRRDADGRWRIVRFIVFGED